MAGDVKINLGGERYQMRPSYNVYREIESRLDLPMTGVLQLAVTRHIKLEEAACIVVAGANEAGETFDVDAVQKRLFEGGFANNPEQIGPVIRLLMGLLYTAPGQAEKKFEAEVVPMLEGLTSVETI